MRRKLAFLVAVVGLLVGASGAAAQVYQPIAPSETTAYIPDGDERHLLDVYRPVNGYAPSPVLLLIHGGGWQFGDKGVLNPLASYFATRGYAIVAPNYRFTSEIGYPAQVEDAFCAFAWIYANAGTYGFDTGRIIVIGESAGGYLATMLGVVNDPAPFLTACPHALPAGARPRGVVAYYPITGAAIAEYPLVTQMILYPFLDLPVGQADLLALNWGRVSPFSYLDGSEPPFLLVHGTTDPIVPAANSLALANSLQAAGRRADLLLIEEAGHGFIADINGGAGLEGLVAVEAFLDRLKPTP